MCISHTPLFLLLISRSADMYLITYSVHVHIYQDICLIISR